MFTRSMTLAVATALTLAAAGPAMAETIRCESDNGRERYCPIDTRGGVVLSTQLSSSGCYQGDTWGYDRGGVWVSGGCRAEFHTGGYDGWNYHQSNDYYYGDRNHRSNDGAKTAIALGAIVGAIAIASAASKNRSGSDSDYARYHERGCAAGRGDGRNGRGRDYSRHDDQYDNRHEQAFASGYNQCWTR